MPRRGRPDRHRGPDRRGRRGIRVRPAHLAHRVRPAWVRAAAERVGRGRRRSPRGRGARGRHRSRRGRGAKGHRRTGADRTDRAVPGRADPKAHCRTRKNHPAPTGHRVHRDRRHGRAHQDGRGRRDPVRPVHRVRGRRVHRVHQGRRIRPVPRGRPGPRGRRRTAVPGGSARRDGSPARGGSSGSRTRHRRRRTAGEAAAGTAAPGSRRHQDPDRGRGHRDRAPDRGQGRVPRAGARPGCRSSRCWSGSSTGTPRRRARRPRGACGTAGRAPAGRRGAGVHRARQGPRGHLRPEAGAGSRAAGIRNRRPGAAVEAAGVRHRPYGDRRPRTSRRNPTGVRSGRSACRRFPLSFPTSRPVPVAATGRCGLATSLHEQSLWTGSRESSRRPP